MLTRTTTRTVTFARPFMLSGVDEVQPAGSYTVETEEELIQTLSFPAYRSTGTWLRLPSHGRSMTSTQAVKLTPAELGEALEKDALVLPTVAVETSVDGLAADRVRLQSVRSVASIIGAVHRGLGCLADCLARIWRR